MSDVHNSTKNHEPRDTPFRQQRLRTLRASFGPKQVLPFLVSTGVVTLAVGIAALIASNKVNEISLQYVPGPCNSERCELVFDIQRKYQQPVYLYYKLTNFYQSYRKYVHGYSFEQLHGTWPLSSNDLKNCEPNLDAPGRSCNPSVPGTCRNPCGLAPNSVFNDTFVLRRLTAEGAVDISMTKTNIAWPSDVRTKFNNAPYCRGPNGEFERNASLGCVVDYKDEDFAVWMRLAMQPTFLKLHRIIHQDLQPGTYVLAITNRYPVTSFHGTKSVVLSTATWIGGRNSTIGITYIVFASVCLVASLAFFVLQSIFPRYLSAVEQAELAVRQSEGADGTSRLQRQRQQLWLRPAQAYLNLRACEMGSCPHGTGRIPV